MQEVYNKKKYYKGKKHYNEKKYHNSNRNYTERKYYIGKKYYNANKYYRTRKCTVNQSSVMTAHIVLYKGSIGCSHSCIFPPCMVVSISCLSFYEKLKPLSSNIMM